MKCSRFILVTVLLMVVCCCNDSLADDESERKKSEIQVEKLPDVEQQSEQLPISENDDPEKRVTTVSTFICGCRKRNCKELKNAGYYTSGVYCIDPDGQGSFLVYCDMVTHGGGWTMIQRRLDGHVNFYREWDCYKDGFGNVYAEHWLGLEKIRRMTSQQSYRLEVDLTDATGNFRYAQYSYFAVASENLKYKLSLGTFSGNAGDSLSYHSGRKFSTKDNDNDSYGTSCAQKFKGAWWYGACHYSNLNGLYLGPGTVTSYAKGITWKHWKGYYYSMKRAEMKIRPV